METTIVIRQVETMEAQPAKSGARPVRAHTVITGDYDERGFRVAYDESTSQYLHVIKGAEIEHVKDMPPVREMETALRAYYRDVQNGQIAALTEQNRVDMVADMHRRGVQAFVPRMNSHGVDSQLSRMEADVQRELEEEAAKHAGDDHDDDDEGKVPVGKGKGGKSKK